MKLTLAGQTVEHVNYLGQATSLLVLVSYSTTFSNGCGLTQCWYPDAKNDAAVNNGGFNTRYGYLIRLPNPKGSFQCAIPMRHIFGFLDDYSKVTYGMRDTLQLIRKDDNDALFRTAAADVGKVVLSKIYTRLLPRIMSFPYRFVCVNADCSLYLKQDPLLEYCSVYDSSGSCKLGAA